MQKLNQSVNVKTSSLELLSILLFSFLPISIIIGNAAINLNIFIINIFFLFYCYRYNFWSWLKNKTFLYLIIIYFFLIFNSIYSLYFLVENEISGLIRSTLFIKFILLVFAFSTLIKNNNTEKVMVDTIKKREKYYENTSNIKISTDNYDTVKISKKIIKNYEKNNS